jgi:flagellar basal-body rod modification protein FlgD
MIKVGDRAYTEGTSTKTSTTSSSGASATNDQFMSLLLAQLTNQNPLEPMDDTEMVNQMVQMNSLTELQKISKALTSMTQTNQFVSATSLIDKTVTYLNEDNESTSGTVSGVFMSNSSVFLKVGDNNVSLDSLVSVGIEED